MEAIMHRVTLLLLCSILFVSNATAQPSPRGASATPDPGAVNVGQNCSTGEWYVTTEYGYARGLIMASGPAC